MRKKRRIFRIRYWLMSVISIIILIFTWKGMKRLYHSGMESDYLKVKQIEVIGNRRFTKEYLLNQAGLEVGMNIVQINKEKIMERLNSPWIETCSIKRYFPYVVKMCIKERRGSAIYQSCEESYLIDGNGYLIDTIDLEKIEVRARNALPRIEYDGDIKPKIGQVCPPARSGVKILSDLKKEFPELLSNLKNIKLFNDEYAVLYVKGYCKKIYVNFQDKMKKLKLLRKIVRNIKADHEKIEYIDLRFKNRIIVGG
ncbi:MAG: cell division protein FtsQ/DivIB [bacterium]